MVVSKCFGCLNVSSFYNQALHVVHMMMIRERHFCMCRTLLDTIISAKDKRKTFLPLPILVTQICKEWILDDEFNDAMQDRVKIVHETVSSSYQASYKLIGHRICYKSMLILLLRLLVNRKMKMMNS